MAQVNQPLTAAEITRRQARLQEIQGAMQAGDLMRAGELAQLSLGEGMENAALLNLAAYRHLQQGRPGEALPLLERARSLAPQDVNVLNALGVCLRQMGRAREAIEVFETALTVERNFAAAFYNKGMAFEDLGELAHARAHYERAIALQPDYPDALARLAYLAAGSGDFALARDCAARALRTDPALSSAKLALAIADVADGRFAEACEQALPLAEDASSRPLNRAIAKSVVADAQDGMGDKAGAFDAYGAANAEFRRFYAPQFGGESYTTRIKRMAAYFESAPPAPWTARKGGFVTPSPSGRHVFLVGFPRSGTTLLGQVLQLHPAITVMEEAEIFAEAARDFLREPQGLERLAVLSESDAQRYANAYWQQASAAASVSRDKVFVDKMPLNTVQLCLVAKIFPNARILFALRDPRDVVLSCFRRRFGMNAAMYELLTLEGAVDLYDAVMRLADAYRAKLGLDLLDTRYEELVADFDSTIGNICDFLGVSPDPAMRDVAAGARSRSINTPSAGQLTRGLYKDGVGQWRGYAKQLEPVLPMLALWVERYHYSKD